MTESSRTSESAPERIFLDANVIRGHLTTDVVLSIADEKLVRPFWSEHVLDEARRHKPSDLPAEKFEYRLDAMNRAYPRAIVRGYDHLVDDMRAKGEDKRVLAAAVHKHCDVVVTENHRDFNPPSTGPHAIRIEGLSGFLQRKLAEHPDRVRAGMRAIVARNDRDPRSMPALIDKMAKIAALRGFAIDLNKAVEPNERGSHKALTAGRRRPAPSRDDERTM
jgi:hypothetical protein